MSEPDLTWKPGNYVCVSAEVELRCRATTKSMQSCGLFRFYLCKLAEKDLTLSLSLLLVSGVTRREYKHQA